MNPRAPTLNECLEEVARFYSITEATLLGPCRALSFARPRQLFMWLARECTRHSLTEIGEFCGSRDHTTVMHALTRTKERLKHDRELDLIARTLKERLTRQPHPLTQGADSAL